MSQKGYHAFKMSGQERWEHAVARMVKAGLDSKSSTQPLIVYRARLLNRHTSSRSPTAPSLTEAATATVTKRDTSCPGSCNWCSFLALNCLSPHTLASYRFSSVPAFASASRTGFSSHPPLLRIALLRALSCCARVLMYC